MQTFKALKPKSKYKNELAWLKAVYRNNKAIIDAKMSEVNTKEPTSNYMKFKSEVLAYKPYVKNKDIELASTALARSERFTEESERLKTNAINAIRTDIDKSNWKLFRELTKDKNGRYTKVDIENLEYQGNNTYFYKNYSNMVNGEPDIIVIAFENSPETIEIMTYSEYAIISNIPY